MSKKLWKVVRTTAALGTLAVAGFVASSGETVREAYAIDFFPGCPHQKCVSTTTCQGGNFGTVCVLGWDDGQICEATVSC